MTKLTPFHLMTSEQKSKYGTLGAKVSLSRPNHITKQSFLCPGCFKIFKGVGGKVHVDKLLCLQQR